MPFPDSSDSSDLDPFEALSSEDRPPTILLHGSRPKTVYQVDEIDYDLSRINFNDEDEDQKAKVIAIWGESAVDTDAPKTLQQLPTEESKKAIVRNITETILRFYVRGAGNRETNNLNFLKPSNSEEMELETHFSDESSDASSSKGGSEANREDPARLVVELGDVVSDVQPKRLVLLESMIQPLAAHMKWPLRPVATLIFTVIEFITRNDLPSGLTRDNLYEHLGASFQAWFDRRGRGVHEFLLRYCQPPKKSVHRDALAQKVAKSTYLFSVVNAEDSETAKAIITSIGLFKMSLDGLGAFALEKAADSLAEFLITFARESFPEPPSTADALADPAGPPSTASNGKKSTPPAAAPSTSLPSPPPGPALKVTAQPPPDSPVQQPPPIPDPPVAQPLATPSQPSVPTSGYYVYQLPPPASQDPSSQMGPSQGPLPFSQQSDILDLFPSHPSASGFRKGTRPSTSDSSDVEHDLGDHEDLTKTVWASDTLRIGNETSTFEFWDIRGTEELVNPSALKLDKKPGVGDVVIYTNFKNPLVPKKSVWTHRGGAGWIDITTPYYRNEGPDNVLLRHPSYDGLNARVLTWRNYKGKQPTYTKVVGFDGKERELKKQESEHIRKQKSKAKGKKKARGDGRASFSAVFEDNIDLDEDEDVDMS